MDSLSINQIKQTILVGLISGTTARSTGDSRCTHDEIAAAAIGCGDYYTVYSHVFGLNISLHLCAMYNTVNL